MSVFEEMLTGGHPNSLGRTVEVTEIVLENPNRAQELFDTYQSSDEVVRLRVSSAFKRIAKAKSQIFLDLLPQFMELAKSLKQPSFQWSMAQITMWLDAEINEGDREKVKKILQENLDTTDDWIVLNTTMEALNEYAKTDPQIKKWLKPRLEKLAKDSRKSVQARAKKFLLN